MSQSKVTTKGQVTIPRDIRLELGIEPGDKVEFRRTADGSVVVEAASVDPRSLRGMIKTGHEGLSLEEMDEAIAGAAVDRFRSAG